MNNSYQVSKVSQELSKASHGNRQVTGKREKNVF